MNFSIKRLAENLLFASNVFIIFLLLFEGIMRFPGWLQSVGRMHVLMLHFPIVLLLMAMGAEFFRFSQNNSAQQIYGKFSAWLLLAGALTAALTVLMGLLLSKENGYDGDVVFYHKWLGVFIVLIASLMYWFRERPWYGHLTAKTSAFLMVVLLVAGGHLGADITHGDDFISSPMLSKKGTEKVSKDKALIYADIVQPIFKAKCMSCHNSGKAKGGLVLDNPEDILKGGKDGKLFNSGHADSSLLLERLYLPEEDKKHMPLEGKPQLTKNELDLLFRWVQSGADFTKKLLDLPSGDSLRLVAEKFVGPSQEEEYHFEAADEKTIHGLSNNYRVVYPLAKESPALAVDFFNKNQFSSKALSELLVLKKQIVQLNLNKMPVGDADLKTISQFENLRNLNLSFTEIKGEGIGQLANLKNLRSLSVSGTKVDFGAISSLCQSQSLKDIYIWNTSLNMDEITQLQKGHTKIQFVTGYKDDGTPLQLNPPIPNITYTVFADTVHVHLRHQIPGVQIHYTLDGQLPDSNSSIYHPDMVVDRTCVLKARAFKPTWLGSDSIMYHFYKSAYQPDTVFFVSFPADSYKGNGPMTLVDHITGDYGFGSGKWLGFQKDMVVLLQFHKPVKIGSVDLHMLKNVGADIDPPVEVQIWGGSSKDHLRLLKSVRPSPAVKGEVPAMFLVNCTFPSVNLNFIKVVAVSVKKIPKWGTSPGKPGWVFTDEILLN